MTQLPPALNIVRVSSRRSLQHRHAQRHVHQSALVERGHAHALHAACASSIVHNICPCTHVHGCMRGWLVGWVVGWLGGWMDGWMVDGLMGGCMDGCMDGWLVDGLMGGCMDVCMYGWLVDGLMVGWWMDGWICSSPAPWRLRPRRWPSDGQLCPVIINHSIIQSFNQSLDQSSIHEAH